MLRQLTENDVTFEIRVEQDDIPVQGNYICSGDEAYDKEAEQEVINRLNNGDIWAWAHVRVIAHYKGYSGWASLGGCCYNDEEDFKECDYYQALKLDALKDLNETINKLYNDLSELVE